MKAVSVLLALVLAMGVSFALRAEEGKAKAEAFTGKVEAAPAGAAKTVTAVLEEGTGATAVKVNLMATGDEVAKVTALVGKQAKVMGEKTADGIKVEKIEEVKAPK